MMRETLKDARVAPSSGGAFAAVLQPLLQIVEDPKTLFNRAFDGRRAALFFAVTAAFVVCGTLLKLPAFAHASGLAQAGPSSPIGLPWIGALLATIQVLSVACTTGLLLALTVLFRALLRLSGSIGQYAGAICAIAAVEVGLAALVDGLIVHFVPVESFTSMSQLTSTIPSLAALAPDAPRKLHALLALVDPFRLWAFGLVTLLFTELGRAPRSRAVAAAALVTFAPAALYALIA